MEVKCEYCGSMISDKAEKCPNCGATNDNFKRSVNGTPQTIAELLDWYKAMKLPPEETTRFFIGKNIQEPKAFGIYEDAGEFIVYKNKADGTRAIRYQGKDEAYAVNELYLKLKSEILNQKSHNVGNQSTSTKPNGSCFIRLLIPFILVIVFATSVESCQHRHDGYYSAGNDVYYYYGDSWYTYSPLIDDYMMTSDPWFADDKESYAVDDSAYIGTPYDIKESDSWDSISSSHDYSSDSDYSWDSGSDWDSGSTDWGSDW